jgi:hypothetical protein
MPGHAAILSKRLVDPGGALRCSSMRLIPRDAWWEMNCMIPPSGLANNVSNIDEQVISNVKF